MQKIDGHVHFWDYDSGQHSWITEDMSVLRRNFLPEDIQPLLKSHDIAGCMLVQVNQTEGENDYFLKLASGYTFVKGIVGWVDLCAENIVERLGRYQQSKIKGFRHILQGDPDRSSMLRPDFKRGIAALRDFGFTYDLLIYPDQLPFASALVKSFPRQPFIIDHLAKPEIRKSEVKNWKKEIFNISRMDNVYCKLSGMITEAHWNSWTKEMFVPYIDAVVESFGMNRIVFGSDWPVCLLAGSYGEVVSVVEDYFSVFSKPEQENLFGGNATTFYGL
ncbi:MAG: amidohydrolase family protein [Bacteroidota bacterium]|nr:amidohydrolase family protein [Bacteroidota bacterium]MDP4249951.1 amidohydrolase family protein [Bacteroidota bacterium]